MGFRSGLLMNPTDTRELVLAGHTRMAALTNEAGRIYLLHSCGDLIDDVKIDAKHSYGHHLMLLWGIDVDFLCRPTEEEIRAFVRARQSRKRHDLAVRLDAVRRDCHAIVSTIARKDSRIL